MEATERTWTDQLFEEGSVHGLREAIRRLARTRFGRVTPALEQALQAKTREQELLAFFDHAIRAPSEDELIPAS